VNTLDLVLHPVRLRIMHALSGERTRTTSGLCDALPDVSKATVYRHTALLVAGGLLEVAGERRVRGAVERRYRLHPAGTAIDRETAAAMSLEDHRNGFAAAMAALIADFNSYLDRGNANPTADFVSYAQAPLWLNRDELAAVVKDLRSLIASRIGNLPAPGRNVYVFSPILFPIEELPGAENVAPGEPGPTSGKVVKAAGRRRDSR
jgi:DNA-binding transcriptional ArsR family regulator